MTGVNLLLGFIRPALRAKASRPVKTLSAGVAAVEIFLSPIEKTGGGQGSFSALTFIQELWYGLIKN